MEMHSLLHYLEMNFWTKTELLWMWGFSAARVSSEAMPHPSQEWCLYKRAGKKLQLRF